MKIVLKNNVVEMLLIIAVAILLFVQGYFVLPTFVMKIVLLPTMSISIMFLFLRVIKGRLDWLTFSHGVLLRLFIFKMVAAI